MTRLALPCAIALLAFAAAGASAQSVYRNVDANGRPVFSDQPPAANARPTAQGAGTPVANAGLPYELRQVVQRYPVTFYGSDDCSPCNAGRSLLITRGVPFEERLVKTNEDIEAYQRLSGQASLPLLAIGAQQLKGFSDVEWSQYLDAAGYPKSNALPAGYRNPPARPLVAQQAAGAPTASAGPSNSAPLSSAPPPPSGPTPDNPAGIKF